MATIYTGNNYKKEYQNSIAFFRQVVVVNTYNIHVQLYQNYVTSALGAECNFHILNFRTKSKNKVECKACTPVVD